MSVTDTLRDDSDRQSVYNASRCCAAYPYIAGCVCGCAVVDLLVSCVSKLEVEISH